jgi:NTE family protein
VTAEHDPAKRGLALSGGGHRAAFFHIGVLARLADLDMLRGVRVLSTVSGGSIVGALYYMHVKALLERVPDEAVEHDHYRAVVASVEHIYRDAAGRNLRGRALLDYVRNFRLACRSFSRTDRIAELYDEWFFRPVAWDGKGFRHAAHRRGERLLMQDLLIRPVLADGSKPVSFDPESDENQTRRAPVPVLLLNATSLNTGHNWRFEAVYVGEPKLSDVSHVNVDRNVRLTRARYDELPEGHREYHLGTAVAASAAFPGGLPPKALGGLVRAVSDAGHRERYLVELTDGGVNDNQGLDGLLDFECEQMIVSDAGGQMADVAKPAVRLPPLLGRVAAIARRASRQQRMLYASRVAKVAFIHLQTGLPVHVVPLGSGAEEDLPASLESGIPADAQRLLARMRTDLDAFSDIEASSMMLAGYRIGLAGLTSFPVPTSSRGETDWAFVSVAARMDDPDPAYLRRLWVSRLRFFKPLALAGAPRAPKQPSPARTAWHVALGTMAGVGALVGIFFAGKALAGSSVPAPALFGVLVGLFAAALLYMKADLPVVRVLSSALYDMVVPFLLALFGVFSIASLGFVFEGWLHRGLGGEHGVRPWAIGAARTFMIRLVPAALLVAGVAAFGLALLLLILDQSVNLPRSLDELTLFRGLMAAIIGGLAVACLGAAILLRGEKDRDFTRALATGVGLVSTGVGLILAVLVAAQVLSLVGQRGEAPQTLFVAYVTLVGIALLAGAIAFVAMTVSLRLIARLRNAETETLPLGVMSVGLVVLALVLGLRQPAKTDESLRKGEGTDIIAKSDPPGVRYDSMLLIDPSDRAGREVIAEARDDPSVLLAPRTDGPRWDTAFGLAIATSRPSGWLVLAQPSTDRRRLVAALARVTNAIRSPGRGVYGQALRGLIEGPTIGWRERAVRSVTIVADRPPSRAQLREGATVPPGVPRVIQQATARRPIGAGQSASSPAVVLDLIETGATAAARRDWEDWTARTGGAVLSHREGASVLDEAENALVRAPSPEQLEEAMAYRPLLLFDSEERRPPIDVDALLAEGKQALCRPSGGDENCERVHDGLALTADPTNHDTVLRVDVSPAAPDEFERTTPQRIYYHLTYDRERDLRYFDYWVFYRFNDSPRLNGLNCLPGLAIDKATCFDHESDWEGVTVAVPGKRGTPHPAYVTYAGHAWRYSFDWKGLVAAGASTGATHAQVWVARGSHASYPMGCGARAGRSCGQLKSDVPDGARDGHKRWVYNDDTACAHEHCVAWLPLTRSSHPASWAGFGGAWGMPRCTVGLMLCVRAQGPVSPYRQDRYARPGIATFADALLPRRKAP